ncbi:MAG: hypothetical protein GKR88_10755 [Flavobacteriaceae bacterium]|nr:MAG: hypothetical protein GKR88_10755 [Flavobacteriaceae bacterium]
MSYEIVFSKLGFDFKRDFEARTLVFDKNDTLTHNLKDSVFFYQSPNNTNTSFYLITTVLNDKDTEEIRRYIWNKNDADLIFYYPNNTTKLELYYAKYSPTVTNKESQLDVFSINQKDTDKLNKINHWRFDSGVFWFNYSKLINKAKYKGIDKELVITLETLKKQLDIALTNLVEESERNEVVQALIDRTLYIKYLEDKHIINSHFYEYYFKDNTLNYKKLLDNNSNADLNKLFKKIHKIFNNSLFECPTIDIKFLTPNVRQLISNSFNTNLSTGQLKLFHFQFDILPIEFISYIYEVFLSEKQKKNGIYYTPKKLAQLIVDEVINEDKIGSVLDPSSGSGMFLIVGFQRLLEIAGKQNLEPQDSIEKIKYRTGLLAENIFGIEKEPIAKRFTLFSLSLQIFKNINPNDIKNYIASELNQNNEINLFSKYSSFFENIKHTNTLDTSENPFGDKKFTYIVGNPPFFEIPNTEEYQTEIKFLESYKVTIDKKTNKKAQDIVGKAQISQCFFLKIKDWANENTRLGFVSNNSNFYNDKSNEFQNYFYSNYGIEKVYELSRVKKILFEKAKESIVALIFTNKYQNNKIDYYPVELGLFSEKPFELLIIQEDKIIPIEQSKLIKKELRLRNFLVGNEYDFEIYNSFKYNPSLSNYILLCNEKYFIHEGLKIVGEKTICKEYNIDKDAWESLKREQQLRYFENFREENTSSQKSTEFGYELLKPRNVSNFIYSNVRIFLKESVLNFERGRNPEIYTGHKIIFNRTGKSINSIYVKQKIYFDFDLHVMKLVDETLYDLVNAILNSKLINYYINLFLRKRYIGSYLKIGNDAILNLPLPKDLDQHLVNQISDLSRKFTKGEYKYSEKSDDLNQLIYELYELSYWEKQRIEDYFLPEEKIGRKRTALNSYIATLKELLRFYFKNPISVEETTTDFNLKVVKVSLNENSNTPNVGKTKKYILNEIFEQNPNENFLANQEKIYGKDCVYIIKKAINKNWTETKAFEDGQDLIKRLIPNEDEERIH